MCDAMNWSHLPMPGGLYNQHPILLERFFYLIMERSKFQEQERKKKQNESGPRTRNRRRPVSRR